MPQIFLALRFVRIFGVRVMARVPKLFLVAAGYVSRYEK
jgi:hypothetical protein